MKICIVRADYYPEISKTLYEGACSELINNKLHINKEQIRLIPAPGIFEVPVIISRYINDYDGFIALGCVIKGKTPHFDFISSSTNNAIMHLSITHKKPIGNGIITCFSMKQALERSSLQKNKKNKGREAAIAVCDVLRIV